MGLRRRAIAPQDPLAVANERIENLEQQIKQLRQASTSTLQSEDMERVADPVPFQTIINYPGSHSPATAADPLVYYHPGDEDVGGSTPAGFKTVGAAPLAWLAVYDPNFGFNEINNSDGDQEVYFPRLNHSDNYSGIFSWDAIDILAETGQDWRYRPILLVEGVYTITYFAKSEAVITREKARNNIYFLGENTSTVNYLYPGSQGLGLSDFYWRDWVGFTQSWARWGRSWTIPIILVNDDPARITMWHSITKATADASVIDSPLYWVWIAYHGPVNYEASSFTSGGVNDPGPDV